MLRFNLGRRSVLSTTLSELANLFVAALVVGQAVNERPSIGLISAGIIAWVLLVTLAVIVEGGSDG